ncbi:MAG: cell division protein ZipA C-terminal FtsZ-binding domain-containing protein, partial [Pseudomonadota bacterium]
PNELSALDAWDAMFAAGQRLADLLECSLLDESGSSLSRQTVAHIRDEMREYDRGHEPQDPERL